MRVVLVCAIALSSLHAEAQSRRIMAVEWLPLGLHSDVLDALEGALKADNQDVRIERESAYGDAAEVHAIVAKVNAAPPAFMVGFGDRVCKELAEECPDVQLLALAAGPVAWSAQVGVRRTAPALVVVMEPEAERVWKVAEEVLPGAAALAVFYTEGYQANDALAGLLERAPARGDRKVVRLTVPSGNCRTDSDFEKALDVLPGDRGLTVLYVPDDPNCSRFGDVICRLAGKRHLVTLGNEAIKGKGCAASLSLDVEALGKEVVAWMRRCDGAPATVEVRNAPYRVVPDLGAVAAHGTNARP